MIITRNLTPYGAKKLAELKKSLTPDEYNIKEKKSSGVAIDLDTDMTILAQKLPVFKGNVYDPMTGEKSKEYNDFKKRKVCGVWFVEGMSFRPLKNDYSQWDGHILLDLDGKQHPIYDKIYNLLAAAKPNWMRLLKKSGSGSLHILCHTELSTGQKNKECFEDAFDAFSELLLQFLKNNNITLGNNIKIDPACRKLTQGMAFWNTNYVLNPNNKGFDVFKTQEYANALQKNQVARQKQKTAKSIGKSHKKISKVFTRQNFEFQYDTTNAKACVWKTTNDKTHAPYGDRLAVVMALHDLGVSEDDTYEICSYGFPENHLEDVRKWYQSANAGSLDYFERNIAMLRKYLTACEIQHTIRPTITIDKSVKQLTPVRYNTYITLDEKEYITGTPLKQYQIIQQIFDTNKDVIYLDSVTGSGKTEMAKYLMGQGKRVCFSCGRNTVLENKFRDMDIIRCYSRYTKTADLSDKTKSLCCSLDWLASNFGKVEGDFDYIIIDEIHLSDEAFRKELMLNLLPHIRNYANNKHSRTKLVLMTATPSIEVNYLDKDKTHFVKISKKLKHKKTIIPYVSKDYNSAVSAMISDIKKAKEAGKKVLICENDTKRNKVLANYFKNSGIKLVDFNRKQKNTDEVDYVLAKSEIPDGYDGMVVTTYFGVGCEIKDKNEWEVFFMPLLNRGFRAGHIEQFSNRVREKEITARIYFHNVLNMGVADSKEIGSLDSKSKQMREEYEKVFENPSVDSGNIDMTKIVEALVKYIDNDEVEYNTYTYQTEMYESPLGTILSLLQNEFGWVVEGTKYTQKSSEEDLGECRRRVDSEMRRKYREATKYFNREFGIPCQGEDEEKTMEYIKNIARGIVEYKEVMPYESGCFFNFLETNDEHNVEPNGEHPKKTDFESLLSFDSKPIKYFFNKYHQEIAARITEFGRVYTLFALYVAKGKITQRELERILDYSRLKDKLDTTDVNMGGVIEHISSFLADSKFPFNRGKLSEKNLDKLTEHISGMINGNSPLVAREIAIKVVKLGEKSNGGALVLDVAKIKSDANTFDMVTELADEKEKRKKKKKALAKKKHKKRKRQERVLDGGGVRA